MIQSWDQCSNDDRQWGRLLKLRAKCEVRQWRKTLGWSQECTENPILYEHEDAIGKQGWKQCICKTPRNLPSWAWGYYKDAFEFKLEEIHNKPLTRLCTCSESNHIHRSTAQIPMNSKAEWHQPVVARVVVTRELEELEQGGAAGQRGRGRGRGRQQAGGRRQRGGA